MKSSGPLERKTPLQRKAPIRSQKPPQRDASVVKAKAPARSGARQPKITKEDKAWARAVKERDAWRCRRCGKAYQPGDRGLQAMHVFSRRFKATRHDLTNGLAGCTGCHMWGHSHPGEFLEWVRQELGTETFADLESRARALRKRAPRASGVPEKPPASPVSPSPRSTAGPISASSNPPLPSTNGAAKLPAPSTPPAPVTPAAGTGWRSS